MQTKFLTYILIGLLTLFFGTLRLQGQTSFAWEAKIPPVANTGFYQVMITPVISAGCRADFADLRIQDSKGKTVAYILKKDIGRSNDDLVPLKMLPAQQQDSGRVIRLHNTGAASIGQLWLEVSNAQASRQLQLSGSHDNQQWYIVRENITLEPLETGDSGYSTFLMQFPAVKYQYLRLRFEQTDRLPMEVRKVAFYKTNSQSATYASIPAPRMIQKDSNNGFSYVHMFFDAPYLVEKISWQIDSPKYFKRQSTLYSDHVGRNLISGITLESGKTEALINPAKGDSLLLIINNGDNTPLIVKKTDAWQSSRFLLAYLNAGESYRLVYGLPEANAPQYDLVHFEDSASRVAARLAPGAPAAIKQTVESKPEGFFGGKFWIWGGLGLGLLLLLWLSSGLLKDLKEKKDHDHL